MTQSLTLRIEGMHCAGCAGRAQKALAAVPGITDATVNLATETAQLTLNAPATAEQAAQALAKAGYPAASAETRLRIGGMTCAGCVRRAETALLAAPGVLGASVNLATETASVRYLVGTTDPATLAQAATTAGYPGKAPDETDDDDAFETRKAGAQDTLRRDLILSAALTLPVFLLAMGSHLIPGVHHLIAQTIGTQTSWLIQFALTSAILIGPGRRFFALGVPALLKGAPEMNALVALGTFAAWAYSSVATFAPSALPETAREVYFEAAAVICTLILLGRWLEARARGRTGDAIRHLAGLRPKTARVLRDGVPVEVALGSIVAGDLVRLRPGETVAVDGTVTEGETWIDESMITGEPVPVAKTTGDSVTGGTVNGTGALTIRATAVGRDTVLARIIRMVEDAQGAKLPIQALVDRVTAIFVPVVLALSLLTVAVWLAFGTDLTQALVAGVAVLIVACPCAMGLATPVSIMVGTGRAAELGVLFRRGDALQGLQSAHVVAFDKTGTLTEGRPELTDIVTAGGVAEAEALTLAAAVEAASEHPLAQAILRGAGARGLALPAATGFRSITGQGAEAQVQGRTIRIGNPALMAANGIDTSALGADLDRIAGRGRTAVMVAADATVLAVLGIADPVKAESRAAIDALRAQGLVVAMITGDAARTAQVIAADLGIAEVTAGVLPDGKVAAIEALRARHGPVAFVGDGINDAPALAAADIGLAIGTGTDIAMEAAEVVLMSGQLSGVARAIAISRATLSNIRQNLFWAFAYNVALLPVAAGALVPFGGPMLSPMLAAAAMSLSSVFVVSNALRLRQVGGPTPAAASAAAPAPQPAPAE